MIMTYHESYGTLPAVLRRTYRTANVSPADHDLILAKWNLTYGDDIPDDTWKRIIAFVESSIQDGQFRMSRYL